MCDGLKGGHSGEDIHRGRGNAIEILIRLLRDEDIRICSLKGRNFTDLLFLERLRLS